MRLFFYQIDIKPSLITIQKKIETWLSKDFDNALALPPKNNHVVSILEKGLFKKELNNYRALDLHI